MSDGGRESGRDNDNSSKKSRPAGRDDFGRTVSKIAVAQICDSTGFHSSQRSALDALAEVAMRFIFDLGKAANFYANLSGRLESNIFDIIQGLEDLGSSHGFSGASDVHHCLVSSGVVRELTQFVSSTEEVPFTRPLPQFPIIRSRTPNPSFAQIGVTPAGNHIPDWLPAFPEPHTYVQTPIWKERESDLLAEKIEQERQRRKAERSLLSLQQRLAYNSASGSTQVVDGDLGKGKRVVESNPFLEPPLPYGEKDISEIVIPKDGATGKRPAVLETFAPAIEAANWSSLDCGISERRLLPIERPTVHLKFGIDKKSIAVPLSSSTLRNRSDSWFVTNDEMDNKKRRAEMILKEAMENGQELIQM